MYPMYHLFLSPPRALLLSLLLELELGEEVSNGLLRFSKSRHLFGCVLSFVAYGASCSQEGKREHTRGGLLSYYFGALLLLPGLPYSVLLAISYSTS